jgi:SAM-dependent methyltransferase
MSTGEPGPWEALPRSESERWGTDIFDPETRRRWCAAIMFGGLPYLWRYPAKVPRTMLLDRLELHEGDRVLLVGEANEDVGFDADVTEAIGEKGELVSVDLRSRVLDKFFAGEVPKWEWTETHEYPDAHFDAVLVGQAVAHAGDWRREGAELLRVMKPGRRIVLGEISFSQTFYSRVQADVHIEYWVRKLMEGMGDPFDGLPYWNLADVAEAFDGLLEDLETFEWRGVDLLWGRKP